MKKIVRNKFFMPFVVTSITLLFFILWISLFEINYEAVDDFTLSNIISNSDGMYNYLCVYIHPVLSLFIMILFKTGININWYAIVLLALILVSFSTIGILFTKKNKNVGLIIYGIFLIVFLPRLLYNLQYTSVATLVINAGIVVLIYKIDNKAGKLYTIYALILIAIGTMLRFQSVIIVFAFFLLYIGMLAIKDKNIKSLKYLLYVIAIILIIYTSNFIIYNTNPTYKKYSEFNKVRTWLFDYNFLKYSENEDVYNKSDWTKTDYLMLYTYSFCDENFYTIDNISKLKNNYKNNYNQFLQIMNTTIKNCYTINMEYFKIEVIASGMLLMFIFAYKISKKNIIYMVVLFVFIVFFIYFRAVYRVLISVYLTFFIIILYEIMKQIPNSKMNNNKYVKAGVLITLIIFLIINTFFMKNLANYKHETYAVLRDVVDYAKSNKQNTYIYSNALKNIFLSYSIFERIEPNTFENIRSMADWDMYTENYYYFKQKNNITNIINDLYKKNNFFLITGSMPGFGEEGHVELIIKYIKQHYDVDIGFDVVKEFEEGIKVYKLYDKLTTEPG